MNADKLIANQQDVNARGEIQWLASVAHGGFLDAGRRTDWGSHRIEHELSAQYNITHGEGMAVVTVAWTKYMAEKKPWRLALLASRVFGVDTFNYSETERAYILSEKLTAFFKKLHLATFLVILAQARIHYHIGEDFSPSASLPSPHHLKVAMYTKA